MTTPNNKISTVVASHVPSFVADDYETFVAFLQAYYEYLEQEGKLSWTNERLEESFDIDNTLDEFIEKFKEQYLANFPTNVLADKALLIKNIRNFYLSKGTEKSVKFLFRALFGEEISLFYPNRSILKVSDGKWTKEKSFRVQTSLLNIYTGNTFTASAVSGGNTLSFLLSEDNVTKANVVVKIGDVKISNVNYNISGKNLLLSANVPENVTLVVIISGGSFAKFEGKKVAGSESGAEAIVGSFRVVSDGSLLLNELTISGTNQKDFVVGEYAYTDYLDSNGNSIIIGFDITSSVVSLTINNGGQNYNVGDPLLFTSDFGSGANGYVSQVSSAGISRVEVTSRGAGFKGGADFNISGGGGTGASIRLNSTTGVDTSGNTHPSSYNVATDIISLHANTFINANSYGFTANSIANANATMLSSLTFVTVTGFGPINPLGIDIISAGSGYTSPPTITLDSPIISVTESGNTTANITLSKLGIIGSLKINNAGSNYAIGDELVFTLPPSTTGVGAAAAVTAVSGTGGIAKVALQAPRISGTVNVAAGSNVVTGTGTAFTSFIKANSFIIVNNETKMVSSVTNDTSLVIANTFTYSANIKAIGVYGINYIGGEGYSMNALPSVTVQSATGSGANIAAIAILGDGEALQASQLEDIGKILSVTLSQGGNNYLTAPTVTLPNLGDGTANITSTISGGIHEYAGYFKNEDGFISGSQKIQDGNFYQFYSYVIKSKQTLDKYEEILKALVHPLGLKYFAQYQANDVSITENTDVSFSSIDAGPQGNAYFSVLDVPFMSDAFVDSGNGAIAFIRTSPATVTDWERKLNYVNSGEIRFRGFRRVENLILAPSDDFTNTSVWVRSQSGVANSPVLSAGRTAPDGTPTANGLFLNLNGGTTVSDVSQLTTAYLYKGNTTYLFSVWMASNTGSNISMALFAFNSQGSTLQVTPQWRRYWVTASPPFSASSTAGIRLRGGQGMGNTADILVWKPMLEEVGAQSVRAPSEHIPKGQASGPLYYGAGVDGVMYFPYPNPWSIDPTSQTAILGPIVAGKKNWLELPGSLGNYANTNGSIGTAVYNQTDTLRIIYRGVSDWGVSGLRTLIGKWNDATGQQSWLVRKNTGLIVLNFNDGTNRSISSPLPINQSGQPLSNTELTIKVDFIANNGGGNSTAFFDMSYDGGNNWISLGSANIASNLFILKSNSTVTIGAYNDGLATAGIGRAYSASVSNIGGPLLVNFDANRADPGANSFVANTGETWRLWTNSSTTVNAMFISSFTENTIGNNSVTTIETEGYVSEDLRMNKIANKEFANTTAWPRANVTFLVNYLGSSGTTNAYAMVEDATVATHSVSHPVADRTANADHTFSVYAKMGTRKAVYLQFSSVYSAGAPFVIFDLANGVYIPGGTARGDMEYFGQGWWRCFATATSNNSTSSYNVFIGAYDLPNSATSYLGNTAAPAILLENPQIEEGSIGSTYIDTAGIRQTRNADSLTVVSNNISNIAGTLYAEYRTKNTASKLVSDANSSFAFLQEYNGNVVSFYDGTTTNTTAANTIAGTTVKGTVRWGFGSNAVAVFVNRGGSVVKTPYLKNIKSDQRGWLPGVSGSYFSTQSAPANKITGPIDIRVLVAMPTYNPAAAMTLLSKYGSPQSAYLFLIEAGATLRFFGSANGTTNADGGPSSTINLLTAGLVNGVKYWLRVTKDTVSGNINYYYATGETDDTQASWIQIGATVAANVYTFFSTATAPVEIGSYNGGTAAVSNGTFYRAKVYNGINGTLALDFNPNDYVLGGNNFVSSQTGETWNINQNAVLETHTIQIGPVNGSIRRLKIYKRELSNTEIQVLPYVK